MNHDWPTYLSPTCFYESNVNICTYDFYATFFVHKKISLFWCVLICTAQSEVCDTPRVHSKCSFDGRRAICWKMSGRVGLWRGASTAGFGDLGNEVEASHSSKLSHPWLPILEPEAEEEPVKVVGGKYHSESREGVVCIHFQHPLHGFFASTLQLRVSLEVHVQWILRFLGEKRC